MSACNRHYYCTDSIASMSSFDLNWTSLISPGLIKDAMDDIEKHKSCQWVRTGATGLFRFKCLHESIVEQPEFRASTLQRQLYNMMLTIQHDLVIQTTREESKMILDVLMRGPLSRNGEKYLLLVVKTILRIRKRQENREFTTACTRWYAREALPHDKLLSHEPEFITTQYVPQSSASRYEKTPKKQLRCAQKRLHRAMQRCDQRRGTPPNGAPTVHRTLRNRR